MTYDLSYPLTLAKLITSDEFLDGLLTFLPVMVLPCIVAVFFRDGKPFRHLRSGALARTSRQAREGWLLLPILGWAAIATYRTVDFMDLLAASHGPDPRDYLVVGASNMCAACVLCAVQVLVLTARGEPAASLGLAGIPRFTSILLLVVVFWETATLLATLSLFFRPYGLPMIL